MARVSLGRVGESYLGIAPAVFRDGGGGVTAARRCPASVRGTHLLRHRRHSAMSLDRTQIIGGRAGMHTIRVPDGRQSVESARQFDDRTGCAGRGEKEGPQSRLSLRERARMQRESRRLRHPFAERTATLQALLPL